MRKSEDLWRRMEQRLCTNFAIQNGDWGKAEEFLFMGTRGLPVTEGWWEGNDLVMTARQAWHVFNLRAMYVSKKAQVPAEEYWPQIKRRFLFANAKRAEAVKR